MKIYIRKIREDRAAISLVVLITILTFMVVLLGAYITATTLRQSQIQSNIRIQEIYAKDIIRMDEIYGQLVAKKPLTVEEFKKSGQFVDQKTTVLDDQGNKVVIPKGFRIFKDSGTNITEGIVIEDSDFIETIGGENGNQYVWVPVGEELKKKDGTTVSITCGRYTFETNGKEKLIQNINDVGNTTAVENYYQELNTVREGTNIDDANKASAQDINTTALGLEAFKKSVTENGGFYIARYEASYGFYEGNTVEAKAKTKVSNVCSNTDIGITREGQLWNFVRQPEAAEACRDIYTRSQGTTDLINSYAWDTAIVYIQNFSDDPYYSQKSTINTAIKNTGETTDEKCKINDMASNLMEWTTEYSTYISDNIAWPCTYRGGVYEEENSNKYISSCRQSYMASFSGYDIAFRIMLYL